MSSLEIAIFAYEQFFTDYMLGLMMFLLKMMLVSSQGTDYRFTVENKWLSMSHGVRLSATIAVHSTTYDEEKFPILLEYKPYRKDDYLYNNHQP